MSGIILPATLQICECGRHGHIVFSDGSSREEFFSLEEIRDQIKESLKSEKITYEEAESLSEQALNSGLPINPLHGIVVVSGIAPQQTAGGHQRDCSILNRAKPSDN